ncbi:MAG: quercetin 2,3-dioxygenase [Verrucomicrobia bacterium]|nr:quercetin 2,3-dioxygenase [Verrucomicrobiota bacterium]
MNAESLKPFLLAADAGKRLNVLGDGITVLLHGRDTGGTISVVLADGDPGHGPPPHVHHREDETFHCIEGEIEGFCGDQTFKLMPGATAFLPRNIPHTWRVAGTRRAKVLVVLTPAGFEEFFEAVGAMSPTEQQDIPRVVALGKKYGLDILPPQ